MTVYLLHFDTPYRHARHYLGSTDDLAARLRAHQSGNGARLMEVVGEAGITWRLARTWEGGREVERRLKRQHNGPRLCPICQEGDGQMKAQEAREWLERMGCYPTARGIEVAQDPDEQASIRESLVEDMDKLTPADLFAVSVLVGVLAWQPEPGGVK